MWKICLRLSFVEIFFFPFFLLVINKLMKRSSCQMSPIDELCILRQSIKFHASNFVFLVFDFSISLNQQSILLLHLRIRILESPNSMEQDLF